MDVEADQQKFRTGMARGEKLAIFLILAMAFALRLHDIARESLWSDEILTHFIASKPLGELFPDVAKFEQIPPVHHLIVHFWMKVFGDSEASIRFPSLLAGVGAVWLIYLLGRRLLGASAAVIAALLLAVSPFQIVYAHEARAYTLMVFVGLLSTLAFVRLIDQWTRRREVEYVLASALLLYVHLFGGFALVAHQIAFFVWLWKSRDILTLPSGEGRGEGGGRLEMARDSESTADPKHPHPLPQREGTRRGVLARWVTMSIAIATLFAPYLPTVRTWFKQVSVNFWVKRVTWDDASNALEVYSGSIPLFLICIALIVLGVRYAWKRESRDRRAYVVALLLSLMLMPIVLPVLYSVLRTPVFSPRYGILAQAAVCLLVGAGVASIKPAALRCVLLLAIVALNLAAHPVDPWKAKWRDVSDYLEVRMRPGDLAIVHIKASSRQYDYYLKRRRPDITRIGFDGGAAPITLPLDQGRHVWFVMYGTFAPPQEILNRGNWKVLSTKWFWDGIMVMELDDQPQRDATTQE